MVREHTVIVIREGRNGASLMYIYTYWPIKTSVKGHTRQTQHPTYRLLELCATFYLQISILDNP